MKTKRTKSNGVILALKKKTVADLTHRQMVTLVAGVVQVMPVAVSYMNCQQATDTVFIVPTQETGITPPHTYVKLDDESQ
jgi:hypothetical protein